jgi:hypothetical protein
MKYSKEVVVRATKKSIEKWHSKLKIIEENNLGFLSGEKAPIEYGISIGRRGCPLCCLFNSVDSRPGEPPCTKCPLYEIGYGCISRNYIRNEAPEKSYYGHKSPYDNFMNSEGHEQLVKNTKFMIGCLEQALVYANVGGLICKS